jgi:hypothetical protein
MYTITEVWTPRPAFEAMPTEAKEQFFGTVGDAVAVLETSGVRCQGWGRVRRFDEHSVDHTWLAVWTAPDDAATAAFLHGVEQSGWYDLFDQDVAAAQLVPVAEALQHH